MNKFLMILSIQDGRETAFISLAEYDKRVPQLYTIWVWSLLRSKYYENGLVQLNWAVKQWTGWWGIGKENKRIIHYGNLNESCRLKGIPSCPKPFSSSPCLGSRTGSMAGPVLDPIKRRFEKLARPVLFTQTKEKQQNIPSTMSLVLWSRKVPERIVTNPHISVTIWVGFCLSQSCSLKHNE